MLIRAQEPKDESDGGEEEAEVPEVLCDVGCFWAERTLTGIQALSWDYAYGTFWCKVNM